MERHEWRIVYRVKCILEGAMIHPCCKSTRFNTKVNWLQEKAEYRNDHQKQAAWLAADESNKYSCDSEKMVQNVILAMVYGLVKSKAPLRQVDMVVSPGFVEGLAAAKAARSTLPSGQGTPKSAMTICL